MPNKTFNKRSWNVVGHAGASQGFWGPASKSHGPTLSKNWIEMESFWLPFFDLEGHSWLSEAPESAKVGRLGKTGLQHKL